MILDQFFLKNHEGRVRLTPPEKNIFKKPSLISVKSIEHLTLQIIQMEIEKKAFAGELKFARLKFAERKSALTTKDCCTQYQRYNHRSIYAKISKQKENISYQL